MRFAFDRDRSSLFAKAVIWKMDGPYWHCEAVFGPSRAPGASAQAFECASASLSDGGVRFKDISLSPERWDVIDVPGLDEAKARQWFFMHAGEPYDLRGLLNFILPFPVGHNPYGWFCDECCGASVQLDRPASFDPNGFAAILLFRGGAWVQKDGVRLPGFDLQAA
jgi:hypothetical protein